MSSSVGFAESVIQDITVDDEPEPEPEVRTPPPTPPSSPVQAPVSPPEKERSFFELILKEARFPLIVGALIFIAGLSKADDVLMKIAPSLVTSGGYVGLTVKSIIGSLLLYAIQRIFF